MQSNPSAPPPPPSCPRQAPQSAHTSPHPLSGRTAATELSADPVQGTTDCLVTTRWRRQRREECHWMIPGTPRCCTSSYHSKLLIYLPTRERRTVISMLQEVRWSHVPWLAASHTGDRWQWCELNSNLATWSSASPTRLPLFEAGEWN